MRAHHCTGQCRRGCIECRVPSIESWLQEEMRMKETEEPARYYIDKVAWAVCIASEWRPRIYIDERPPDTFNAKIWAWTYP